ncbi:MAG: hypothetical protein IKM61_03570 [Eubacteriaceae bacterium]|nr:hypothetical protein [Eubacteriaceae bacterium]
MTYEQALYYKILIINGFEEEYHEFVNEKLISESPLSDIILELSFCGRDKDKILSVLGEYLLDVAKKDIDSETVENYLRNFIRDKYLNENYSVADAVDLVYSFMYSDDYLWRDVSNVYDYHLLAEDGIIKMEDFVKLFEEYLLYGKFDSKKLWGKKEVKKENFFKKVLYFLTRRG